jgi:hypothetical protein
MDNPLFRKESLTTANSPEQLKKYIRITNPSVWIVLAAVLIMLIGIVVWGVFGTITTTVKTGSTVTDGKAICYVSTTDIAKIKDGLPVIFQSDSEKITGSVISIAETPDKMKSSTYLQYYSGIEAGDLCYRVEADAAGLPDGVYKATVQVEKINPIVFVIH